jgi:hypothetical protein
MDPKPTPNEQAPAESAIDSRLRMLREVVGASIASLIVLATVALIFMVFFRYVGAENATADKHFERAKDLLLFINPLLGVVIGYYFNKVSTEARAEKAEATVATANNTAQQAKTEADRAKAVLDEVVPAAQEVLNESTSPSPGTLSAAAGASGSTSTEAQAALRAALQRAKQLK